MAAAKKKDGEPDARAELASFEEGDFHCLASGLCRDPQYDDRRLVARRKLLSATKVLVARAKELGAGLEARSSLHSPNVFNGMQVRRLWGYAMRDKEAKRKLKGVLGADLAKDLDAAYRNAYLCIALEAECLEVSLRVHADAWFDGTNLVNRVKREGLGPWREQLNQLEGFTLRLADWKGEWRCGELGVVQLEQFLKYYKPAEHALSVEQRVPAPPRAREHLFAPGIPGLLVDQALRLVPLQRFLSWSEESDFLFSR
ncbi:MAG: hypothetical protein RIR65_2550 [Planctomycetota bacterium]|jgi:hypothetical protein